jgi:hypothetical protein
MQPTPQPPISQADLEAAHTFEQTDRETVSTSRPSVEGTSALKVNYDSKIDEIEPPFEHVSRRRLEALASLLGFIAISQLPLFTISGSLGITLIYSLD